MVVAEDPSPKDERALLQPPRVLELCQLSGVAGIVGGAMGINVVVAEHSFSRARVVGVEQSGAFDVAGLVQTVGLAMSGLESVGMVWPSDRWQRARVSSPSTRDALARCSLDAPAATWTTGSA